jgi:hypothetical protein
MQNDPAFRRLPNFAAVRVLAQPIRQIFVVQPPTISPTPESEVMISATHDFTREEAVDMI